MARRRIEVNIVEADAGADADANASGLAQNGLVRRRVIRTAEELYTVEKLSRDVRG